MQTLYRFFLPCALLLVVLVAGCDTSEESGVATFTGSVVDSDGEEIPDAVVSAVDYGISTRTGADGTFVIDVEVDSSRTRVDFEVFADGFEVGEASALAFIDRQTEIPEIVLRRRSGDGGGVGGTATLTGRVVNAASGAGIDTATVRINETGAFTRTNARGEFTIETEIASSQQDLSLTAFAPRYVTKTVDVRAFVDQTTPIPDIELERTETGGGGSDGDPGGPDGGADQGSGPAASITLLQRSSEAIGVQSAGADETATLSFVVLDAYGNPVSPENAVEVTFAIASGPGGGAFLEPASAETNDAGRVQTTISSGTISGTVQIVATATTPDGAEIRSYPVVITITGGLPDLDHFSVVSETRNFPGYDVYGRINPVTAFVGDRYGNPVQPGTAVYFTTDAGIVGGSGTTDNLGRTTVDLVSAAPLSSGTPPAACPDSDATGYGTVTARTSDDNQETIETQTKVLFSAESEIMFLGSNASDSTGLGNYRFRVSDRFGHPLSPGTTIQVTADGVNVEAVGDVDVELGDYLCPGPGRTEFVTAVVQGDEEGEDDVPEPPVLETLTVKVQSPNGNIQLTLTRVEDVARGAGGAGVRYEEEIVRF